MFPNRWPSSWKPSAIPSWSVGIVVVSTLIGQVSADQAQVPQQTLLLGNDIYSPFVDYTVGISHGSPKCKGVRAPPEMHPSPYKMGSNYSLQDIRDGHRRRRPMRAFIWSARAGLGNSFQGFTCTFIYSFLSGRQLVASTGGVYGSTFETVAIGFAFPLDRTGKQVYRVPTANLKLPAPVRDPRPVLQGNPNTYCDYAWFNFPDRRECVLEAMSCSDLWCIRSRLIKVMLGNPTDVLGEAIRNTIRFDPPITSIMNSKTGSSRQLRQGSTNGSFLAPSDALKIRFDLAVHLRTETRCIEGQSRKQQNPGCVEGGLKGSLMAIDSLPEVRFSLMPRRLGCVAQLLAFLLKLKIKRLADQREQYRGLFKRREDEEELLRFTEQREGGIPVKHKLSHKEETNTSPLEKHGLWRIEDSEHVANLARDEARKEGGMASNGPDLAADAQLNILLATDSVGLRPLLVKYLRPFGHVAYSAAKVVHLAYSHEDQSLRLGNLGEFYLISRAAVVLSYREGKSSYARAAALYGNSTMIYGTDRGFCKFPIEHVAQPADQF